MRTSTVIAFSIVAAFAFSAGRAAESLSNFRIIVTFDRTTNDIVLKCTEGCAWTDLRFGCRSQSECQSPIDESGMTE